MTYMGYDIEDLFELIKKLEERILILERNQSIAAVHQDAVDHWYWRH